MFTMYWFSRAITYDRDITQDSWDISYDMAPGWTMLRIGTIVRIRHVWMPDPVVVFLCWRHTSWFGSAGWPISFASSLHFLVGETWVIRHSVESLPPNRTSTIQGQEPKNHTTFFEPNVNRLMFPLPSSPDCRALPPWERFWGSELALGGWKASWVPNISLRRKANLVI
jgi:hypothetical protein